MIICEITKEPISMDDAVACRVGQYKGKYIHFRYASFRDIDGEIGICSIFDVPKKMPHRYDPDGLRDIAIKITNKLIELGYVPDCTDTDDESEFEVQDEIVKILEKAKWKK